MDKETKAALNTMMARINDNHETVLQRFRGIDDRLDTIDHSLTAINQALARMLVTSFTE